MEHVLGFTRCLQCARLSLPKGIAPREIVSLLVTRLSDLRNALSGIGISLKHARHPSSGCVEVVVLLILDDGIFAARRVDVRTGPFCGLFLAIGHCQPFSQVSSTADFSEQRQAQYVESDSVIMASIE